MRGGKASGASRDRPGEGASFVAEQLGLEQRVGEGGAVDRDERFAVARAAVVERAGDQLLAGAGLAEEQDRRVARRDRVEAVHHPAHDGRATDDLFGRIQARELQARLAQLALNRHLGRDPLDAQRDVFAGKRLPEVVVGAFPDGRDGLVNLGEGGHQDHDRGRPPFPHQPEQRQAIELREPDVGQHDVDRQRRHELQGLLSVVRGVHLVTGVAQHLRARQVEIGLVVDQQDAERAPDGAFVICSTPKVGMKGG